MSGVGFLWIGVIFGLVALLCLLIFGFRFLDLFLGFFPEPGLRPAAQSLPFASPKALCVRIPVASFLEAKVGGRKDIQ